ncbi:MAG: hypothetical protein WBA93_17330 [Microcoleaceae cyanobacterium]
MLFFISPISTVMENFSQEKALLRAYLGLSQSMAKPVAITNPIAETRFYYGRLLSFLICNLDNVITEIEAAEIQDQQKKQQQQEQETIPEYAPVYAPVELPENLEIVEDIENPTDIGVEEQTPDTAIDTEDEDIENWPIPENPEPSTDELFSELKTDSLKDRMLSCKCKQELEAFKLEVGEFKAIELWESLDILERNHIKSINLAPSPDKAPAPMGYLFQYTDNSKTKHQARLIGHYLYGEPLKDNERAILISGNLKPIVVKNLTLKPYVKKDQKPMYQKELEQLQQFLTTPQKQDDEPDAATIAALKFTGLAEIPKPQAGSNNGKKPASQVSNVVEQPELPLVTEHPKPKELPATPTPALEALATELHNINPQSVATLNFKYESIEDSIFLTILHEDSEVACFEDNGNDVYAVGDNKKLTYHGFTKTEIDAAFQTGEAVYEQLKKA